MSDEIFSAAARLWRARGPAPVVPGAAPDSHVLVSVRLADLSALLSVLSTAESLDLQRQILRDRKCMKTEPYELAAQRRNVRIALDTHWAALKAVHKVTP